MQDGIDGHVCDHLVSYVLIVDDGQEDPVTTLIVHHCQLREWETRVGLLQFFH